MSTDFIYGIAVSGGHLCEAYVAHGILTQAEVDSWNSYCPYLGSYCNALQMPEGVETWILDNSHVSYGIVTVVIGVKVCELSHYGITHTTIPIATDEQITTFIQFTDRYQAIFSQIERRLHAVSNAN
jgi:hypothetical protein